MMRRLHNRSKSSLAKRTADLRCWLDSETGQALVKQEKKLLERETATVFGFYAGQYALSWQAHLLGNSPVRRQFILGCQPMPESSATQLIADPMHWPVAPGSLDLVLLQHTLEIADSPHRLLSEAANCIIPEGKLVIIGFNPYSLLQITRWCVPSQRRLLREAAFITPSRLRDWLALLNFRVEKVVYGGYVNPVRCALSRLLAGVRGDSIEARLERSQIPMGGFYLLSATRETPGIIPMRKVWSDVRRRFVGQPLTEPSAGRECG